MAANYYTPAPPHTGPADIHPSWCDCHDCAEAWEAAHRADWRGLRTGLILGVLAAAILAIVITQVPA